MLVLYEALMWLFWVAIRHLLPVYAIFVNKIKRISAIPSDLYFFRIVAANIKPLYLSTSASSNDV